MLKIFNIVLKRRQRKLYIRLLSKKKVTKEYKVPIYKNQAIRKTNLPMIKANIHAPSQTTKRYQRKINILFLSTTTFKSLISKAC